MPAANLISLTCGFEPGAIGRVAEMHGLYYCRKWGFGLQFEGEVAAGLAKFRDVYDPANDGLWLAHQNGRVIASATLDHSMADEQGSLRMRWVIADDTAQGSGVGRVLMDAMMRFADERRLPVYLWTFEGLIAARRLYQRAGFVLTHEREHTAWGPTVTIQRMERPATG